MLLDSLMAIQMEIKYLSHLMILIIGLKKKFNKSSKKIKKNIQEYRLDFAINEVYEFFWSKFCDIYIEECKKTSDTKNLRPMLQKILVMMHPFAPFITEEIHTLLFEKQIIE